MKITMNSKIKDVYQTPVGHDILNKKKNRFVYERKDAHTSIIVDCNLSHRTILPYTVDESYELIWPKILKGTSLSAYNARIWKRIL